MGQSLSCLQAALKPPDVYGVGGDWRDYSGHPGLSKYEIERKIGRGGFSEVVRAKRKPVDSDGEEVALKIVFLGDPRLTSDNREVLSKESLILHKLNHPHIIDVRRTFMSDAKQQLVMEVELLRGKDLLAEIADAVQKHGFRMRESWARCVTAQLLAALRYMHAEGVIHRDLKHDNIRCLHPASEWVKDPSKLQLKVFDFGLATMYSEDAKPETGLLGSSGYIAPEVIKLEAHTPAMDMYAVGVILFVLLVGCKPMTEEQQDSLEYKDTPATEYANMQDSGRWDAVSKSAQSLICSMLALDPSERMTASEALEHPWLRAVAACGDAPCTPASLQESDDLHQQLDLVTAQQREQLFIARVKGRVGAKAAENGDCAPER